MQSNASVLGTAREQPPRPRSDVVASETIVGDELFLYCGSSSKVHCLNSGAAIVWLLCDGEKTPETMAHEIADAFSLEYSGAIAQVEETIKAFQSLGLLE